MRGYIRCSSLMGSAGRGAPRCVAPRGLLISCKGGGARWRRAREVLAGDSVSLAHPGVLWSFGRSCVGVLIGLPVFWDFFYGVSLFWCW